MRIAAIAAALLAACTTTGELSGPRDDYNDGTGELGESDWTAAQRDLLAARDQAGADAELRFHAAYNLALALAGEADGLAKDKPEDALAKLRDASRWLGDAVRLRPDRDDARRNLEVVLRRIQQLADRLNQGENNLAKRLDRLIEDQRGVRDRIRQLMDKVDAAGAAAEPRAFQSEHDAIGTDERTLVGEAGTILDLAGDEVALIDGKPEDQRSQEEQARLAQLRNLEHWMGAARGDLADTRLALRRLQGDRAHRRADVGLGDLVRAREQLEDPIKVLQGLAQEEAMLLMHTGALEQLRAGKPLVADDGAPPAAPAAPSKPPSWLTTDHLGDRQTGLADRTGELLARLQAGVAHGADASAGGSGAAAAGGAPGSPGAGAPQDPRMAQILAEAGEAVPLVEQAIDGMHRAGTALAADQLAGARDGEADAVRALIAAVERFADLRNLIELTWTDQNQLVALLDPDNKDAAGLKSDERQRMIGEAVGKNQDRLNRMKGLIQTELATAEAQAQQAAAQAQGQGQAPAGADPQQLAAERARYQQAEELRARALVEVDALAAIAAGKGATGDRALDRARAGLTPLDELRVLFFTLIQHLERLRADQAQTHDRTATAQRASDDQDRDQQIGPLADFQAGHADLAESLATAVEQQADAASQASDDQGKQAAQRLQQAAPEVRAAATAIRSAAGLLGQARAQAGQASVDLEPTLDQQKQALAHLDEALRILQPPKQQPQDPQDQNQQDQQQQVSQQEAERRLQQIREREAERRREQRDRQQQSPPEPVEKDW